MGGYGDVLAAATFAPGEAALRSADVGGTLGEARPSVGVLRDVGVEPCGLRGPRTVSCMEPTAEGLVSVDTLDEEG